MAVDIEVSTVIARPPAVVAAYACDPTHAPLWYAKIDTMAWRQGSRAELGAQMDFVAQFMGRTLAYTYEITELVPGERMVMRTAERPFPMETVYRFEAVGTDATRMVLQNRGEPAGFSRLVAPLMGVMMRKAMTADLVLIKQILESPAKS